MARAFRKDSNHRNARQRGEARNDCPSPLQPFLRLHRKRRDLRLQRLKESLWIADPGASRAWLRDHTVLTSLAGRSTETEVTRYAIPRNPKSRPWLQCWP